MGDTIARRKPRCKGTYPAGPEYPDGATWRCGLKPRHQGECAPGELAEPNEQPTLPEKTLAEKLADADLATLNKAAQAGGEAEPTWLARPPSRYSATYLETATACLHAAYLKRRGDVGGDRLDRGKVVHLCTAAVAEHAYARQVEQVPEEDAREIAAALLKRPLEEAMTLTPAVYDDAIRHAGNFAAAWRCWPDANLFLVEHLLTATLGGRTFSGRLDVLQIKGAVCKIDDVKSSPFVPDVATVRASIQNPLYGRLAYQEWPFLEQFDIAQLYTDEGNPQYARVTPKEGGQPITLEEVLAADDYLDAIGEQLDASWAVYSELGDEHAAKTFPALGGWHCRICPAAQLCPIPRELNPDIAIESEEDARRLLRAFAAVDAWREAVDTEFKGYVDREGLEAIVAGGVQRGWIHKSGGWSIKKGMGDDVEAFVREHGDEDAVKRLLSERRPGRSFTSRKAEAA